MWTNILDQKKKKKKVTAGEKMNEWMNEWMTEMMQKSTD